MNRNFKLSPTISSISTMRTITEKDTTCKHLCNNPQWVQWKSEDCKPNNLNPWDQENQNVKSGKSNLAKVINIKSV
jgi:hypothetical protein